MAERQVLIDSFVKRFDAFARDLPDVAHGNAEALHRTRVASRRLRELLPLLALDRVTTRKLNRRLRDVTKQLGVVRELDVLTSLIDQLNRSGRFSPIALAKMSEGIERARDAARTRMVAKLPSRKLQRLARTLRRLVKSWGAVEAHRDGPDQSRTDPTWVALDTRLAHRATRVRTAIDRAGALYAPEPLHDVRIALKKLRYATELSFEAERRRPRLAPDLTTLKGAQDLLGRLHDCEMLVARGRDVQASMFPPDLVTWRALQSLVHVVEDDCRQMHARYMRNRAELIAIADRFGAEQILPGRVDRGAAR